MNCSDIVTINKENLRQNFNTLISVLNINISKLCRDTNYDVSTVFRFRNGSRQPSDPIKFTDSIAAYVSKKMESTSEKASVAELIGILPRLFQAVPSAIKSQGLANRRTRKARGQCIAIP